MEDQVPFKVFAFWNGDSKAEVRRFGVEKTVVTSYHYLIAKLQDVYPSLKGKSYTVTWKDEDGDDITISSDEEMMTALTALHGNLMKLNVYIKSDGAKDDDCNIIFTAVTDHPPVCCPVLGGRNSAHYGVMCDACNTPVVGFRYKCTSCDDFDLCSKCEGAGLHPEHCMVRVPSPVMPRHLIKAAIKRSRHFLKTVSAADDNSHKRHRHDKSGDRRHHHGERKHDDPNRRQRTSWLDTFATYMNEFANLAGDMGVDLDQPKGPTKPQEQAKTTTDASTSAETPQTAQPAPNAATASANANAQCPVMDMANIPQLIQMYFNGTLASYMQQRSQDAQPAPTPSSTPAPNDNDVDMASAIPAEPKPQEADKVSIKSEASSSAGSVRDASPEKVDGWTVINKEKDFMDSFDKPSAPAEPAAPIGFNLPHEFQQRVNINEGQSLYPPLHAAAAVPASTPLAAPLPAPLTPQQAQKPAAAAAAFAAAGRQQPQPQPQPQRQPQPGPLHPKPHIDAAIKQMLAMGFTNEGGWLTMMLENVDGNIAAVMDLLTPVKPQ